MSPFKGKIFPQLPKPIPGSVPGILPDPIWDPSRDAIKPQLGLLVIARMSTEDPAASLKAIQALAVKLGGVASQFDDEALVPYPEGALIFIPIGKAEGVEKALEGVARLVYFDRSRATDHERRATLERAARGRLADLEEKRAKMLAHYFEDATPVVLVTEDRDRIKRSLAALGKQKLGEGMALIWVKFV